MDGNGGGRRRQRQWGEKMGLGGKIWWGRNVLAGVDGRVPRPR